MNNNLLKLARPEIVAMSPYISARKSNSIGTVWLDANENPYSENQYYRYPEPQSDLLISKLANLYNVNREQLLVTRGSNESIELLIRLFCRAYQDKILICPPTYGFYEIAARIQGAGMVSVPLVKEKNFTLNLTRISEVWQPNIKLIFLCSPNNPTGNLLSVKDILYLCEKLNNQSIIVVDEAYIEFSLVDSLGKYLNDFPNLVILRTLSKAYGLAGIRCGTTIADVSIINLLKKIIAPYPIPQPVLDIAVKQLSERGIREQINIICAERDKLYTQLLKLSCIKKIWKSNANFLLFEVSNAQDVRDLCLKNGISIRDRSKEYNLNNCLRISIGTANENALLIEVLNRA